MDDLRLIDLMAASYTSTSFSYRRPGFHATVCEIEGIVVITPQGSATWLDWVRDFRAIPVKAVDHPEFGPVHGGFLADVEPIEAQIRSDFKGAKIGIDGHSKGGADGLMLGAFFVINGHVPEFIVTCGAPKVGFKQFANVLSAVPRLVQYRHGDDVVPTVPLTLDAFPYEHARPLTEIGQTVGDDFEDHHIQYYRAAYIASQDRAA